MTTAWKAKENLGRMQNLLRRRTLELKERTKELRCLYGISRICHKPGAILEEMLQEIVELIPASWQFPENACARLVLQGKDFRTDKFVQTRRMQRSHILVHGKKAGVLEIYYKKKLLQMDKAPFLDAERKLLGAIAERLGKIIEQKHAEQELRLSHQRLRSLVRGLEEAREDERRRIAHEIHDELGHALMGLQMDTGWLKDACPGRDECLRKLQLMSAFINKTIRNVQRVASELKPVLLDDFGLEVAITTLAGDFEERYGISCKVVASVDDIAVDKGMAIALYRSVQELLTNVARHAKATKVAIKLKVAGDGLKLCVKDNGKGIGREPLSRKKSLGLLGIRERVNGCGGKFQIKGFPNKGTSATIFLPLEVSSRND